MSWESNRFDLGVIREDSVNRFPFTSLYPLDIIKIKPGCGGCTTAKYIGNTLHVEYKPGKIPKQLIQKGRSSQQVAKTIVITYKGGQQEVLTFTANIIKK